MPPAASSRRIRFDAAGVDSIPSRPVTNRRTPFAAHMRAMTWIASRLKNRPSPPVTTVADSGKSAVVRIAWTNVSR